MPATNILATGNSAAAAEFTVASGDPWTVALKGVAGEITTEAKVNIGLKDDAGAVTELFVLDGVRKAIVVSAPGTYRVTRAAGPASYGVFRG